MAQNVIANGAEEYYSQGLRKKFHLDGLKLETNGVQTKTYADTDYELDEAKYHERTEKILAAGGLATDVPSGFPPKLEGPLVWTTADFDGEEEYLLRLSSEDIEEINKALTYFKEQRLEGDKVGRESFPLPKLGKRLTTASDEIYNGMFFGRGFVIVRGLDPDHFSAEDHCVVYLGISSYIAERRGRQDQRGSMLMHVIARHNAEDDTENPEKPFHNDTVCDTLALITKSLSANGGRSILSSSWTVYNELASTRPDILHVLANPDWPFDTYGRKPPYYKRACLFYHGNKAIMNLSRRLLVGHPPDQPRSAGIPGLSEAQAEALDAVHYIAEKHAIHTSMEKGDMRFINNMAILHRREAFINDSSNERHLIRVWLNNEAKCWDLPDPLRLAWARVFDDEDRQEHWDVAPGRFPNLSVARSCD